MGRHEDLRPAGSEPVGRIILLRQRCCRSEVVTQGHRVGPCSVVLKRIGRITGAAEEELVINPGEEKGFRPHVVLQAQLQPTEAAVLDAVAVDAAQAGAEERPGTIEVELIVEVTRVVPFQKSSVMSSPSMLA